MKFALVTGGRDYAFPWKVRVALTKVQPDVVIHGDYGNADLAAKAWGQKHAQEHGYPAEWTALGRKAGPLRNRTMAIVARALADDGHEVVCLAFPGGNGTADCVRRLELRGFTVLDGEAVAEGAINV